MSIPNTKYLDYVSDAQPSNIQDCTKDTKYLTYVLDAQPVIGWYQLYVPQYDCIDGGLIPED